MDKVLHGNDVTC